MNEDIKAYLDLLYWRVYRFHIIIEDSSGPKENPFCSFDDRQVKNHDEELRQRCPAYKVGVLLVKVGFMKKPDWMIIDNV